MDNISSIIGILNGGEFLHSYTFLIKHKSRIQNQVADVLSRRHSLLATMQVKVLSFEVVKELFKMIHILVKFGGNVLMVLICITYYMMSFFSEIVVPVFLNVL